MPAIPPTNPSATEVIENKSEPHNIGIALPTVDPRTIPIINMVFRLKTASRDAPNSKARSLNRHPS